MKKVLVMLVTTGVVVLAAVTYVHTSELVAIDVGPKPDSIVAGSIRP